MSSEVEFMRKKGFSSLRHSLFFIIEGHSSWWQNKLKKQSEVIFLNKSIVTKALSTKISIPNLIRKLKRPSK